MSETLYSIHMWDGSPVTHPKAIKGPTPPEPRYAQLYTIVLSAEEVINLSADFDVMIQGAGEYPGGTKKNPNFRLVPSIWLDQRGGRFRVR